MARASYVFWTSSSDEVRVPPSGALVPSGVAVILGPSGSGKTSILEALSQSLPPALPLQRYAFPEQRWFSPTVEWMVETDYPLWYAGFARWMTPTEIAEWGPGMKVDLSEHHFTRVLGQGPWTVRVVPGRESTNIKLSRVPPTGDWVESRVTRSELDGTTIDIPLPSVLYLGTDLPEPGEVLEAGFQDLSGLMRSWHHQDPDDHWALTRVSGEPRINPSLFHYLVLVERLTNELLPDWILRQGRVELTVLQPWQWLPDGKLTRVRMRPHGTGASVPPPHLGAATRRWLSICLSIALAQVRVPLKSLDIFWLDDDDNPTLGFIDADAPDEEWDVEDAGPPLRRLPNDTLAETMRRWASQAGLVILIDEPELHLHPAAQREVAAWITKQNSWFDFIALSTHSPAFLALSATVARFYYLTPDGLREISSDVMGGLEDYEISSGFSREAWLLALRAILFVEGQHDLEVLDRFFGDELRRGRIKVIPMRGGSKWKSVAESEFLAATGIPLYFLFDNVRVELLETMRDPSELSTEERWAWQLMALRRSDRYVSVLPYDDPDIVAAISPDVVARRFPHVSRKLMELLGGDLGSWQPLIQRYRDSSISKSFKDWLFHEILAIAGKPSTDIVAEIVKSLEPSDKPTPPITRAIRSLLAATSIGDELMMLGSTGEDPPAASRP